MINKDNNFIKLIENCADTYQDLKEKNKKLREIIIKITEELKILNTKNKSMEKEFATEKQVLLDKLDQITNNYKIYAEGYKEKTILKKDIGTLLNNYKQNNKVLNSFKDSFSFLLKKNISMYYECKKLDIDINNIESKYEEFIINMKNQLYKNIIKFKKSIDMINFPDFYKEYMSFVEYEGQKESSNNKYLNKYKNLRDKDEEENCSKNGNKIYINKRKSFGKNRKYSFTKIDINMYHNKINDEIIHENNLNCDNKKGKKLGNNKSYKETNFYKNYLRYNNKNQINYSEYGNYINNY